MVIKVGSMYKTDGSYKNNERKESWDTDEHINDITDWFSEMIHKQFRITKKTGENPEIRNSAIRLWSIDFQWKMQ